MPSNKDLKRLVRARMRKTGEAYTAARAQLVRKSAPDYAARAGKSDAVMKARTGRTWSEWVEILDGHDAAGLSHRERAELVSATYNVPDWWTQTVAVGYERIKGLRAIGQRMNGTYEASKSRTYDVPVSRLYEAWAKEKLRSRWLREPGVKIRTATPRKSMRLGWSDGTLVAIGFMAKGTKKSAVAVQHTKLPDKAAAERLKHYWADRLDALREVLSR